MDYRQDADVIYPFYRHDYADRMKLAPVLTQKSGNVCMFCSENENRRKHIEYLEELSHYIQIDSIAKQFYSMSKDRAAKKKALSDFKFVISFENVSGKDFVTERFFEPLLAGTVPVYFGAPNIQEFSPGDNCFVDVRQFENPRTLAGYLNECLSDDRLYSRFFDWKSEPLSSCFQRKVDEQKVNPFIRLCWEIDKRRWRFTHPNT